MRKAIRRAIDRIGEQAPAVARHLSDAVRTGAACRYDAPPGVTWHRVDTDAVGSTC